MLFITPEKINQDQRIRKRIKELGLVGKINRIVIDEAHCVSQWGHDFRKDYLTLNNLRHMLKDPETNYCTIPILALTATATEVVRKDVIEKLGMKTSTIYF